MATSRRPLEVHSSPAETAAATMTSHPPATTDLSTSNQYIPTFLGLPAELRNIIYSYVFTNMVDSSPKPHALTRVNQLIRHESLAMYYTSVTQLDILMRTLEDIRRVRKWLAEEDMRLYPVFPDIRLFLPTNYQPMVSISCVRRQFKQADISQAVHKSFRALNQDSDEDEWDWAMFLAYDSSLGVSLWRLMSTTGPTERFREVAQGNAIWIYREVTCDHNPFEGPLGYSEERQRLGDMFTRLAIDKDGHDWDEGDLGRLVGFFERGLGRVKILDS